MHSAYAREHTKFTKLYTQYAPELLRHARAMLDADRSEDVVQETFLKGWVFIAKGGQVERERAFFHRILRNAIVDEYRKHKNLSLDRLLEQGFSLSVDDREALADRYDGACALALIQLLPEQYKDALTMRYARSLSLGEIARLQGLSKNALGVRVHRGLAKLRFLYHAS